MKRRGFLGWMAATISAACGAERKTQAREAVSRPDRPVLVSSATAHGQTNGATVRVGIAGDRINIGQFVCMDSRGRVVPATNNTSPSEYCGIAVQPFGTGEYVHVLKTGHYVMKVQPDD